MSMRASEWRELFRPELAAFTVILNLGIGLHAVDVFVISTVMPTVVRDIGGAAFYSWPTMLYMVASIVGAASGGPLKAALGPRKGYGLAGLLFCLGSAACGASPAMAVLLVARTVQGYGGGLLLAQSMGLISELYPPALRTRILAMVSGVWGVAALVGPLVGGVFAEFGWWRGAFWASTPIILWFTARAWQTLPRTTAAAAVPPFPIRRIALLALGVLCAGAADQVPALAATIAPTVAASSVLLTGPQALLLIAAAALTIQAFRLDAAASNRLFPPRPLSVLSPIGTAYWIMLLFSMTHTAIGIYLPLALQVLHGVSPLAAGYANASLAVSWTVASFITAGWRGPAEAAAIIGGPLIALLAVIGLAIGVTTLSPLLSCVLTGLIGFGIGGCNLHLVAQTMRIAEPGFESLTASSIPTIRSLGISFGAAIAGLIANTAGLAGGVSVQSVAAAASWVYAATILAPGISLLLAVRVLRLRRTAA
ncbi:MAG TPA: MFS transporter [Candidatus Acidoferrum sp.]|nr:MFS transporter [Candidatus Acidoferrum sp.]